MTGIRGGMEMERVNLELPYPPTVNHYYTIARGRKILSKRGRLFKEDSAYLLSPHKKKILSGRLFVEVIAYPPDKRKRDLDNILKPILDVLGSGLIFEDDSQVDELTIKRSVVKKPGLVKVKISEITPNRT